MDRKVLFSTLWIFVVLNYLYCDVEALMDPVMLKQFFNGSVGGIQMNERFLLGAAILMEISISMVLLSRLLKYKINRWANIIAGTITTIVQSLTLLGGAALYYIFFSAFEIATTSFIVWYAWTWHEYAEN